MMTDNYSQFSRVAENYRRYRPHYPQAVIALLRAECGLSAEQTIADIGSGTGLLTERFLQNGNNVYGVEPNPEMRKAAEDYLSKYARFSSINGSAEVTTLDDHSVDMIAVGQAFHWFKPDATRREFLRILKPDNGWVVMVYNLEHDAGTPFAADYGKFWLTYVDPNIDIYARKRPESFERFFGDNILTEHIMPNEQICDFAALQGRILSSSRSPKVDDPRHTTLLTELRNLYDQHQANGTVTITYTTRVLYGQLTG